MQLPSIDRSPYQRPSGADLASASGPKVIPVAPVNPTVEASGNAAAKPQATPGVVNLINQANKPNTGEGVYYSVSDPAKIGSGGGVSAAAEKDWTIRRPEPVKTETPPPEPISKLLLEFLRQMWRASGSAVEATLTENQAQAQAQRANPAQIPGEIAKAVLTYSPTRITNTEKSLAGNRSRSSTTP